MLVVLIALFKLFQEQRQHCVYYSSECGGVSIGQFFFVCKFFESEKHVGVVRLYTAEWVLWEEKSAVQIF